MRPYILLAMALTILFYVVASTFVEVPDAIEVAVAEEDPVVASFEREFNHEPAEAAAPTGETIEDDELYRELNAVHWTDVETNDE